MKLDACDLHVFKDEGNLIIATHALTVSLKGGKSKKVTVCESCLSDVGNMFHLDISTATSLMDMASRNGPGQPRGQKPMAERDGRLCPHDGIVVFGGQGLSSHYRKYHTRNVIPEFDSLEVANDRQKMDGIANGPEIGKQLIKLMGDEEWGVRELYEEAVAAKTIPKNWSMERGFRPFVEGLPNLSFTDQRHSLVKVGGSG